MVFQEHRVKDWSRGSEEKRKARLWGTCIPNGLWRLYPVLDGGSLKGLERNDRVRSAFYKGDSVASVEN